MRRVGLNLTYAIVNYARCWCRPKSGAVVISRNICKIFESGGFYAEKGPSIKYVTLFWANFDPPPPVTLCHTSRDPPKVRHTSRTPRFLEGLVQKTRTKAPLYKFCLNCSRGFVQGFCQGSFYVWKALSGVVFVHPRSVRIHLLHQKVKHHFTFRTLQLRIFNRTTSPAFFSHLKTALFDRAGVGSASE